ncbi:MAG TPA: glycosyltransferase [Rhodocyclaceae bacterium]|nr:glycosyltransferase [Rhodocyclaceae bacterium]
MNIRQSHQLLIAAHTPLSERGDLEKTAKEFGLGLGEYVITHDVLESDLPAILGLCKLFVMPAWEAGFGLSALEAMACGKAVIGADTPCHRQIIGRKEALFEPWNITEISDLLLRALTDKSFHSELERYSQEQTAKLSFGNSAKKALAALETCHTKHLTRQQGRSILPVRRPKMAFISPLPPKRTGIADYSAELLAELARYYDIDVIVEQQDISDAWVNANCQIRDSAWLLAHMGNYERVLYHMGNSEFHQHMFWLLDKVPGVVVLHDFYLTHFIAGMDFSGVAPGVFARELYKSHGYHAVQERYKDNLSNVIWHYPCNLGILQKSIGVIVHSETSMQMAQKWYGDSANENWSVIPLLKVPAFDSERKKAREILDLEDGDFVVCSFGAMGSSKLNHRLLDAWLSSKLAGDKKAVLIFVGEQHGDEYGLKIVETIESCNAPDRIRITGWVDMATFRHYLAATDVSVQLRSLSRGETSAAVLDCMNYGSPTIVNANGSMASLPEDGVWKLPDEFSDKELIEALEKLWAQPALRKKLGGRARDIVLTQHSPRACADQYAQTIEANYLKANIGPAGLATVLARVEPYPKHNEEYASLARSIVSSIPARPIIRQLLVDISTIVNEDLKTGIQRVTRGVLRELLENPPAGFRVEPVYGRNEGGYWYARKYSLGFLDVPAIGLADDPAEFNPGDVFFVLDWNCNVALANRYLLNRLRNKGIQIQFMVYDILPIMMPQYFPKGMDKDHHRWLQVVTESDGAICISKAVADSLQEWIDLHGPQRQRPFNIGWAHIAADIDASFPTKGLPVDASAVLKTLKDKPTFLMVGTVEPRKGYAQTIAAFERLWSSKHDVNLVIVGKQGWNVHELSEKLAGHPQLNQKLFWLKGITDEYLTQAYAASNCLIAASEGEGFGLPLIEGALHGLSIIARDIPVFREVAGDHATYFKGAKSEALSEAILQWLDSCKTQSVTDTKNMPYVATWAESTQTIVGLLLDDRHSQWVHRWKPTKLLPQISAIDAGASVHFDSEEVRWIDWSIPESSFRWNLGRRSAIRFVLAPDHEWQGKLVLKIGTLGTQRIGVQFNGVNLGEETLTMNDQEWIIRTDKAPIHIFRENELVLDFHDARQPAESDRRFLAMWIKKLTIM